MKKGMLCGVILLLGSVGYLTASQTNIFFTIVDTTTGTTNTGSSSTGSLVTGWAGGGGIDSSTGKASGSMIGTAPGTSGYVIVPSTGEFADEYERGKHYGLIEKRETLYEPISRVQFAQMMSKFITNVWGESIAPNSMCNVQAYKDFKTFAQKDYQYIKSACDVGLMGWNGDRTALLVNYNPYQLVTRDQMATIFSRMLYGTTYDSTDPIYWYKLHIQAMMYAGFISKNQPTLVENRINILTILRRMATLMPHGKVKPYMGGKNLVTTTGELWDAYMWGKKYDLVTLPTYDENALYTIINRGELAKMLSVFSQTILGKTQGERVTCDIQAYGDYETISNNIKPYVQRACNLGIMGISSTGSMIHLFRPYDSVTRAEFGTVLSRVLYGPLYDTDGSNSRYLPHLEALSRAGYIHDISDPSLKELQAYILLILHRIALDVFHL